MREPCTARIDQNDAAVAAHRYAFDHSTDAVENDGHRFAAGHQFQQPLFTGEQRFGVLAIVDVV